MQTIPIPSLLSTIAAISIVLNLTAGNIILDQRSTLEECIATITVLGRDKKSSGEQLKAASAQIESVDRENARLRSRDKELTKFLQSKLRAAHGLEWEECGEGFAADVAQCSTILNNHPAVQHRTTGVQDDGIPSDRTSDTFFSDESSLQKEKRSGVSSFCTAISKPSDGVPSTELREVIQREMDAARVESIIRQRVLGTIDMAFDVCRKQGSFRFEDEATQWEIVEQETMETKELRKDSVQRPET